ncbi:MULTISPECIES: DUF6415 family natural product biosynthesis protein [unclassified Streptomyces]|uniref:DUF6415 family natural product biosynthesis protein n=1 Tax=unclassified Streptomyces TaxID=2593676 RepID=UPI002E29CBBF|nr:DUF6415 family natural product biosynthesis protein [Streptomyces sp. NBC_00228]
MANATAPETKGADRTVQVDVKSIRATTDLLLSPDPGFPGIGEEDNWETLYLLLRGLIMTLIPQVEIRMMGLPESDVPRACASACIGEAQMRLRIGLGDQQGVRIAVAQRLARSVKALLDHYENLASESHT